MAKNPFAGYKEGKESKSMEKKEPSGLKAFEKKKGMERPMAGKKMAGKKC
jgi:hypothetical protein